MWGRCSLHTVEAIESTTRKETTMSRQTKSSFTAALIVALALLVPAAQAQPINPPTVGTGQAPATPSAQVEHGLTSTFTADASAPHVGSGAPSSGTPDGFDWSDAGIGAGAMFMLIGLGTAGALAVGRARARHGRPAPAS
jgi:hypothetical protein